MPPRRQNQKIRVFQRGFWGELYPALRALAMKEALWGEELDTDTEAEAVMIRPSRMQVLVGEMLPRAILSRAGKAVGVNDRPAASVGGCWLVDGGGAKAAACSLGCCRGVC